MQLNSNSEFLHGARSVLLRHRRPMRVRTIWETGRKDGVFSDRIAGKTPWQTLKSKLSVHILREGDESVFVRTAQGVFFLRELLDPEHQTVFVATRQSPSARDERVVVFPSEELDTLGRFQGVSRDHEHYLTRLVELPSIADMPRAEAEQQDDVKQFLVYIAVTRGGQILKYRRGAFSLSDAMLLGSDCVGFGGHVSTDDSDLFSESPVGLFEAAARELLEEINLPSADRRQLERREGLEVIGVLNDDSSQVGRRHFAVVMRYEVIESDEWDHPVRGEKSINQLGWVDLSTSDLRIEQYEYWSQLLLREFYPETLGRQTLFRVARNTPFRGTHVVAVVGQVGSGKSEACRVLEEEFGYTQVNSGRVLADLLKIPPVPTTGRAEFQRAANQFISRVGAIGRLSQGLVRAALEHDGDVLVDGVRNLETLVEMRRMLAEHGRKLAVLYVDTSPDTAFRFYQSREDPKTDILRFLEVRDAPVEREVPLMKSQADAVVYNWSGFADYKAAVATLMSELLH
jgi:predicted NUDIX family phosphoesterase/dephospho-CoA kinase